ncbi:glycine--tRNA ligase [Roseivirga seohaensis]|uniref:Glycine--tRNA ligase n=1 Tax=Roseivirga seohaensis TaxID=1914963 RepID=A0A150XZS8_9BACT|nr:glycine--tRNA ligase [Roseivirga seohaensis]KYG84267.1 glycine--tRNA ligase [Roseivirga seohaensis]|tara:strand:- start:1260 stop:2810 length:1551 start_codon:yes stop_codon:yes gene_type:complete
MAQNDDNQLKKIAGHAKEYGFIFQSSEIYDGLSAAYDYGQNGVELKNNIKQYWWKAMVQMNENIVGIDSSIFMHPTTWKASGHVDAFNDPMIDNKDSKKRYRADVLVEEYLDKIEAKITKEVEKAEKRFGDAFDKEQFLATNPNVLRNQEKIDEISQRLGNSLETENLADVKALIEELGIADPVSGSKNWTDVRQFNLMFSTEMGSVAEGANKIYLRPETAQGIFVNFLNVQKSGRMKVPFGIAQIGKAFRNEIIARQFIFRMREFEQMEMQFFVKPGEELTWYETWKEKRMKWHKTLGLGDENYRFHDHINLAHYANAAADIQFNFPMGFKELEGIHSRTDFDLKAHEEYSGKKLQFFDTVDNESFVPYVVETSIGLDRMFLAVLSAAYTEETLEDGSERTVLKIPAALAPYQVAILPLLKKEDSGLPQKARAILADLQFDFNCQYDEKDAIGKRYRRQDAIGTPYCVTVDHQTLEDNTVTIRDRDDLSQIRISVEELKSKLTEVTSINNLLRKL